MWLRLIVDTQQLVLFMHILLMVPYTIILTRPLLGFNWYINIQVYTQISLTSIIEGYLQTSYLFMMVFNPYNIYEILYSAPIYGNSSIFCALVIG